VEVEPIKKKVVSGEIGCVPRLYLLYREEMIYEEVEEEEGGEEEEEEEGEVLELMTK
jgi:hypothetical protein